MSFIGSHSAGIEGRALCVTESGMIVPAACACCLAPAATSALVSRHDGLELIVSYCDDCQHHRTRIGTRTLSIVLASGLLGLGLAAAVPLAWVWISRPLYLLLVVGASLGPLAFALWLRARHAAPHTTTTAAVWWLADGRLFCTNPRWASEFCALNQLDAVLHEARPQKLSAWLATGPVIALAAGFFFYWLYHPLLRVLNLTDSQLEIRADGRRVALLEPTSAETPTAGAELYLPAGRHEFEAVSSEGQSVSKLSARLETGRAHLYAPGATEYCFWLEIEGYGRSALPAPEYTVLSGERRFWVLPSEVDNWFSPNPEASDPSSQTQEPADQHPRRGRGPADKHHRGPTDKHTGGLVTALRQGRCEDVPYRPTTIGKPK